MKLNTFLGEGLVNRQGEYNKSYTVWQSLELLDGRDVNLGSALPQYRADIDRASIIR